VSTYVDAPPVPAAWYADPLQPGQLRWWDGASWTDHTSLPEPDAPLAVTSPASSADVSDWDCWQQGVERVAEPGQPSIADRHRSTISEPVMSNESSTTAALWILIALPIAHLAVVWLSVNMFAAESDILVRYAMCAAPAALYIWLAQLDRTVLVDRGFAGAPRAAWAIVPPLYLVARAVRVSPLGLLALVAWLAVAASSVLFMVLHVTTISFMGLTIGPGSVSDSTSTNLTLARVSAGQVAQYTAPFSPEARAQLLTPEGMADKLEFDYAMGGVTGIDITCMPLESTQPESHTTCTGLLAGAPLIVEVTVSSAASDPFTVTRVSTLPADRV
jgi:hypothetical protein